MFLLLEVLRVIEIMTNGNIISGYEDKLVSSDIDRKTLNDDPVLCGLATPRSAFKSYLARRKIISALN